MVKEALSRKIIRNHLQSDQADTGTTWSDAQGPVRIGRVNQVTEHDLRLPSTAVAPHFSLMLLLEGRGHFEMQGAGWCEFLAQHVYLTCSWRAFNCEDYVPAHVSFRAIFLHFPLALRAVVGETAPLGHADAEVLALPDGAAWIARLAMDAPMRRFAAALMADGLPQDWLELLRVQYQSLEMLHRTVSTLLLRDGAPALPANREPAPADRSTARSSHIASRDRRQLLEARRHIDQHLAEPLRIAEVAAACGLSESTLKTGFRQHFGSSVYDYLLQKRCELATALLKQTELSVLEVATQCGFSSTSLLARHFKARFGLTPLQVRNR